MLAQFKLHNPLLEGLDKLYKPVQPLARNNCAKNFSEQVADKRYCPRQTFNQYREEVFTMERERLPLLFLAQIYSPV